MRRGWVATVLKRRKSKLKLLLGLLFGLIAPSILGLAGPRQRRPHLAESHLDLACFAPAIACLILFLRQLFEVKDVLGSSQALLGLDTIPFLANLGLQTLRPDGTSNIGYLYLNYTLLALYALEFMLLPLLALKSRF